MSFRKYDPLFKIINKSLIDLPSPINLTVNWNYGSILGLILVNQLLTGIILAIRFSDHISTAFDSVVLLTQDSSYGWILRLLHSTGASFFFFFMYLHIGRGLYYGSFKKINLWNLGVLIYLLLIGTAFLGYVLPWGQISYWAATVITNLLSAIPILGNKLVIWVWGGFAVRNPTLTRFFTLHFLFPFIVTFLVILHIFYLHLYTSSNPIGINSNRFKISFHYYYTVKDSFFFLIVIFFFILFSCLYGYNFIDPENFIPANVLVTPTHIQPEWYFSFAYAILRAIPNKLGGVIALLLSVFILFFFRIKTDKCFKIGFYFNFLDRLIFWRFVVIFLILTWLGSCPAEIPYIKVRQIITILYFSRLLLILINVYLKNIIFYNLK